MKRKGISLLLGVLVLGGLGGMYAALKLYNQKAEEQEEIEAAGGPILEIDATAVTGLSFLINGEEVSFSMQEDGTWQLEGDETFPVDSDALLSPVSRMSPLYSLRTLTDAQDIGEYGLDEPQNKIVVTDENGGQTILTIGATNSSTGNDYLMMNDEESTVYTVDTALRTAFSDDLYDYAVSESIPWIGASDICSVSVEREADSYKLYLEDAVWKLEVSWERGLDADADAVNEALSSVAGLSYVDYLDHNCTEPELYGLENPAAVLCITYKEKSDTEEDTEVTDTQSEAETETAETETETVGETGSPAEQTLTILVGNTDSEGNYYVQLKDSTEVHTISSSGLDVFLSAAGMDWEAEEIETETEIAAAEETETGKAEAETGEGPGSEAEE